MKATKYVYNSYSFGQSNLSFLYFVCGISITISACYIHSTYIPSKIKCLPLVADSVGISRQTEMGAEEVQQNKLPFPLLSAKCHNIFSYIVYIVCIVMVASKCIKVITFLIIDSGSEIRQDLGYILCLNLLIVLMGIG